MSVGKRFRALVDDRATTYDQIRDFLEGLSAIERRDAVRAIHGPRRHARLFALAEAGPRVEVEDFVTPMAGPLEEVIFYGQNSLPAFTKFEKRFCRPAEGEGLSGKLIGYNHQTMTQTLVTGPGYFVVRDAQDDPHHQGGVAIDYTRVPSTKPVHWPDIHPNERGLSHFVFAHMVDYMRALSSDVFIGRAVRKGKVTDNYFILSRA